MKLQTLMSLAVFFGLGLTSTLGSRNDKSEQKEVYKCEYQYDDCGNQYGGSYCYSSGSFGSWYPKPQCQPYECYKCEYKKDKCGYEYGGSYNSCKADFDYWYKEPECKGHKRKEDEDGKYCNENEYDD